MEQDEHDVLSAYARAARKEKIPINNIPRKEYTPKGLTIGSLVLNRTEDTGLFENDIIYFITEIVESEVEVAKETRDMERIPWKDVCWIGDWTIRRPIEACLLLHTCEPGIRLVLMKNLIINMSDKSITENREEHLVLKNKHCCSPHSHFDMEEDNMRMTDRVDQPKRMKKIG